MTLWYKRALINTAIWTAVAVAFLLLAFTDDGPAGLLHRTGRRDLIAASLGLGIVAQLVVARLTRARRDGGRVLVDERDREIESRASQAAFRVTAFVVFFGCIIMEKAFRAAAAVPVGWVWFLGYFGWILTYLAHALAGVVCYLRADTRGEG